MMVAKQNKKEGMTLGMFSLLKWNLDALIYAGRNRKLQIYKGEGGRGKSALLERET